MKVRISNLAILKLEKLSEYLNHEWSDLSNQKFLQKLNSKIKALALNPKLFPASSLDPKLRKCVVSKQTSLLYEIQKDSIFILTIIDTRQDEKKIKEEIDKRYE